MFPGRYHSFLCGKTCPRKLQPDARHSSKNCLQLIQCAKEMITSSWMMFQLCPPKGVWAVGEVSQGVQWVC